MGKAIKRTSVEDQMRRFNLTKEEAMEKIRIYREKLSALKSPQKIKHTSIEAQPKCLNFITS